MVGGVKAETDEMRATRNARVFMLLDSGVEICVMRVREGE